MPLVLPFMTPSDVYDSRVTTKQNVNAKYLACVSFFALLCAWLFIPFGATGDMDYHLASIWCAHGEKNGLCANINKDNNTASVPFMFQICDERDIYFWPYCEIQATQPDTQRLRLAPPEKLSLYYRIVHPLVDQQIQLSVAKIRLMNSLIATLVLFALLSVTTTRIKFAAVVGFSFSIIPFGIQHFSGVTTRGWALLSVMTSWAFLASYLQTPKSEVRLRLLQLTVYSLTFLLALFSRIDALVMVLITSLVVAISFLIRNNPISKKRFLIGVFGATLLALSAQFLPRIKNHANFTIPEGFGVLQYLLFQLVHTPEYMADWWHYQIGQDGSGPGIIGLIGVLLFALNTAFALQKSDFHQRFLFISFGLIVFALLAKSSSSVGAIVPLSAFYTLGIAVPWLGITIANSQGKEQFMSTSGNRKAAITLLSFSHALFFFNLIEFYTNRGVNVTYFESISLNNGWWWDIWIQPNTVFLAGAFLFPLFMLSLWRTISKDFPEK
jgi:hypothetical protein